MRSLRERLRSQLADLKMPGSLEALDSVLTGIDGGQLGAGEAISQVLEAQISLRNNRRLEAAMRSSRLPAVKTLADFDFSFHEHASTVLTSNKSFEEWGEIFGDEVMAAALIDRLLHHCHIVNIRGNSYRMRGHSDLWRSLQLPSDQDGSSTSSAPRRSRRRKEALT
jgi:DNA replication protein DnaC